MAREWKATAGAAGEVLGAPGGRQLAPATSVAFLERSLVSFYHSVLESLV